MNCEAFRQVMTALFEQTLAEPLRYEACSHLSECEVCRQAAEDAGNWEVEFLKLNELKAPEVWLKHWENMTRVSVVVRKYAKESAKVSYPNDAWKFWVAGACLFLASAIIVSKYLPQKYKAPAQTQTAPAPEKSDPQALRELNEIAKRFGIKMGPDGKPIYVPAKVIATGVQLKPLHAHLKFSSEADVAEFQKLVISLKPDENFNTPSLWVLSVNRLQLLTLLEGIKKQRAQVEGEFPNASKIPIFEGFVRISFYIDRTFQPVEALLLYQHWHFNFQLTNSLDLFERLKSQGVAMLYEAPEIWIFETPASNLKNVLDVVGQCSGLKTEFMNPDRLPDSGKIPIRISVFVKER